MAKTSVQLMTISNICDMLRSKKMVFPSFQRGFVWNNRKAISLLESIYNEYPIGMIMVLDDEENRFTFRTISTLKQEEFLIPENKASNRLFVIDGSHRLYVLYNCLFGTEEELQFSFSLETEQFIRTSRAMGLDASINLRDLYSPDKFFAVQRSLFTTETDDVLLKKARKLHEVFLNYQIPVLYLHNVPTEDIIEIYQRINTVGRLLTRSDLEKALKK